MDLDLKNKNLKIIVLIFLYLLVFYFLIFKNILKFAEIKELIEQEDIKIGKLDYEKNIVLKALDIKRKDFEKDREKIEKQEEKSNKDKFNNIPSLFNYIEEKISKNNVIFQSFGRSRKDGDKLKVLFLNFYFLNLSPYHHLKIFNFKFKFNFIFFSQNIVIVI